MIVDIEFQGEDNTYLLELIGEGDPATEIKKALHEYFINNNWNLAEKYLNRIDFRMDREELIRMYLERCLERLAHKRSTI